jgi:hypothetical protein
MKRLAQLMLTRFFDSRCVYVSLRHIPSLHSIRHNEYDIGNKEDEWMCQGCEMLA